MSSFAADPEDPKILNFSFPYFYLLGNDLSSKDSGEKWAVFLGNDFKNMSHTIDREEYIKQTDFCLDYIRRNCKGQRLIYKPHPNETDEWTYFNMESFEVVKKEDNEVAEVYFWKHLDEIKYVFSIASGSLWSAYILGLNSYTFVKPVQKVLGKDIGSALDYYSKLPSSFFLEDYSMPLKENKKILGPDQRLEDQIRKELQGSGDIWMITGDPGLVALYISFRNIIKKIFPGKKVNLIIPRHERWSRVKESHYRNYFERIVSFSRCIYSLRPKKFLGIIKTVFSIKKFPLPPKDVLFLFANTNLVENCFLSFFKNKKIAVQAKDYFEINYEIKESEILRGEKLRERLTTVIFRTFIEPILGLHRSTYLEYGDGRVINRLRFLGKPTEIYYKIYTLSE